MAVKSPTISPFHRDVRDQEPVPQSDEQTSAGPHRMVKVSPEPEAEPGCSSDELFCPGVRCGFCGGPCDKGDWANLATFTLMISGGLLRYYGFAAPDRGVVGAATRLGLAFGLFGFAGGITNALAVKMLFDRIPGMVGSGVIPRQYLAIRAAVKETVLRSFFDRAFLEQRLAGGAAHAQAALDGVDLAARLRASMAAADFDAGLAARLEAIGATPEGMMLQTLAPLFGGVDGLVPALKPMLGVFGEDMAAELVRRGLFEGVGATLVTVEVAHREIDILMTARLEYLTPRMVKSLLEEVIRKHLGWLVVWGNVFGAIIGVLTLAFGYGQPK